MRCSLLLCTNRGLSLGTHHSVMQAVQHLGWQQFVIADGGLDRARGVLVSNWYTQTRDDAFVMIDDDMVFSPGDLVTLITRNLDVVSATYPSRSGEMLVGLPLHPEADHAAFSVRGLLEMANTGMGCVAIRRHVIERMVAANERCNDGTDQWFWPLFMPQVRDHMYYGEDASFCLRAREADCRLWLDTSVQVTHLSHNFPINLNNLPFVRQANGALAGI